LRGLVSDFSAVSVNSAATQGIVYKLSLFQENASAIRYSAGWTRQTLSGANGGSVDFATVAGKTATFSFTGFQAAWMSAQGPSPQVVSLGQAHSKRGR